MHLHGTLGHGVPDCCEGSTENVLSGDTRVINSPTIAECLGVHGTLVVSSSLTVETLIVYEDGELVLEDGSEIVIADTPIDLTHDPEQWSHSLLIFGKTRAFGKEVAPFVRLAQEVTAGQTSLPLGASVTGWVVGDRLVLPETRQQRTDSHSEVVTIQDLIANKAMITSPQFDHNGARNPDGELVFLPHAANLSRSIVIRSENPNGTRGHIAVLGRADFDWRGVEIRDMGRTTAAMIDSTTFDADHLVTHIGTNQIGRYSLHFHHCTGPETPQANGKQFTARNLSVNGIRKWGIAVHNTHWGLVEDCVVYDGQGAGIVTEDGSETANEFIGNFVAKFHLWDEFDGSDLEDPFMRLGSGIVMRAPNSVLLGNVFADTREGINYLTASTEEAPFDQNHVVNVPKAQGLDTMVSANVTQAQVRHRPRLVNDNSEVYASTRFGLGLWVSGIVPEAPITNLRIWHSGTVPGTFNAAIFGKYTDYNIDGMTLLNEGGEGLAVAHFNGAIGPRGDLKVIPSVIRNADVRGFVRPWLRNGQIGQGIWEWRDSVCQNVFGFPINNFGQGTPWNPSFTWKNVTFLPMPGKPLSTIETEFVAAEFIPREIKLTVEAYQGNPSDNFRVYFLQPTGGEPPAPCTTTRPEIVGYVCPLDSVPVVLPPAPPDEPLPATVTIVVSGTITLTPGTYILRAGGDV